MENFNLTLQGIRQIGKLYLLDCIINEGEITQPTEAIICVDDQDFPINIGSVDINPSEPEPEEEIITLATLRFPLNAHQLSDINDPIIIRNITLN